MIDDDYNWGEISKLPNDEQTRTRTQGTRSDTDRVYRGDDCLEILLPGVDDPDDAIKGAIDLTEAVKEINPGPIGMDKLELLATPGDEHLKFAIIPYGSGTPSKSAQQEDQEILEDENQQTLAEATGYEPDDSEENKKPSRLVSSLKNALEEADEIPDSIGLRERKISFKRLGAPVPVSRLLARNNPDYTDLKNFDGSPQADLFGRLLSAGVPFVYQVIVGFDGSNNTQYDYTLSVRLAVFEEDSAIATEEDMTEHMASSPDWDLLDFYGQPTLETNLSFDVESRFAIRHNTPGVLKPRDRVSPKIVADAQETKKGTSEFTRLIHGTHTNRGIYKTFDLNSKLPVKKNVLSKFLQIYHAPLKYNAWDIFAERNGIEFLPCSGDDLIKDAPGTSTDGQEWGGSRATKGQQHGNRGSDLHEQTVEEVAQLLRASGYEVTVVEQTGDSVPDLRAVKDGVPYAVEVTVEGSTKPANVLGNILRAEHNGEKVLFYAVTKDAAQKVAKQAEYPVRGRDDDGLWAYTGKSTVEVDDLTILLPGGDAQANWRLRPDGTGELWHNGEIVASGDLSQSVTTFEFDLPRCKVEDEIWTVIDTDGTVIETFDDDDAFKAAWTKLYVPLVPSKRTYTSDVEVYNLDNENPTLVTNNPDWDVTGKTLRYRKSITHFFRYFTAEVEGEELHRDPVREWYWEWYETLCDRKSPDSNYFGAETPDRIKTKKREDEDGNKITLYRNRTWIFPEGIISPDLPFIEE